MTRVWVPRPKRILVGSPTTTALVGARRGPALRGGGHLGPRLRSREVRSVGGGEGSWGSPGPGEGRVEDQNQIRSPLTPGCVPVSKTAKRILIWCFVTFFSPWSMYLYMVKVINSGLFVSHGPCERSFASQRGHHRLCLGPRPSEPDLPSLKVQVVPECPKNPNGVRAVLSAFGEGDSASLTSNKNKPRWYPQQKPPQTCPAQTRSTPEPI